MVTYRTDVIAIKKRMIKTGKKVSKEGTVT